MANLEVVQSIPEHAKEIGRIRAANWGEQYSGLDGVTPEWVLAEIKRISGRKGTRNRAYWIEQALQPGAPKYWLSALVGKQLVGFLEARKHEDGTQELHSLHLARGQRRRGAGQALMDRAQNEWFSSMAATYLEVAEVNLRGQRFYQRSPNNYIFTGHRFMYGPISMLQMVRPARS